MTTACEREKFENAKEYFSRFASNSLLFELCDWAKDSARLTSDEAREDARIKMCAIRKTLMERLAEKGV